MKKYILERSDGGVSILTYLGGDKSVEKVISEQPYEVVSYREVEETELPASRAFRDAWEVKEAKVVENYGKSVEIKKNEFRKLRKPLLQQLDIDSLRAIEKKNALGANAIAAQKKALRDVTEIDLPDSVDALRNYIPTILK